MGFYENYKVINLIASNLHMPFFQCDHMMKYIQFIFDIRKGSDELYRKKNNY